MADEVRTVRVARVEVSPRGTWVHLTDGSVLEGVSRVELPEAKPFDPPKVRIEALIFDG